MTKESKTASERYQKISQLDHILKRPDTYIGSVESQEQTQWIYNDEKDCMEEKNVSIVPGLFKIFDEILVNAADNKVRDPTMKRIYVTINSEDNLIEVKNDGKGIPIEIHEKEKIYIPELIFGHLLTSSNYDDDEKKVTGGRNGYGAKLCNIFSTEFILETADPLTGKKYTQKWESNMSKCHPPKITAFKSGGSFTKVSFKPDLKRFSMEKLDSDILGVMRRRVYDINASVRDITVYLNGKSLKIRSFKNYVELYIKSIERKKLEENGSEDTAPEKIPKILYERVNDSWELAFCVSDGTFQQISFVNSIATTSGGTHVNYITDQLVRKVSDSLKKEKKSVKPFQIKNNMFIFINCLIQNPAFTSQTKEQLTSRAKDFGSVCDISKEYIKKIMNTDLSLRISEIATKNDAAALKKTDGSRKNRITSYTKLEDANKAGTREGHKCTLVLTEGDSALSLAVAGLAVVGRDYYGCYPLRGKILNVREASADQILKNAEIQAIKKIMGLQHAKRYENASSLRYGHLMIMTDQDHDGSHIKGLIINFLDSSFPGLLDIPGFLIEFITPIVKVTIMRPRRDVISFYNMPDYEKWREEESHMYTWKQKYYKGLGTSTAREVREYFTDLDRHLKKFHSLQDGEKDLIELAFSKKKADDRKEWLRQYEPGTVLDSTLSEITISDFINKELILFSLADNVRSIPNVLDGFKPGQRKVLYAGFKRNLKSEIKVSEFAAYVSGQTAYHHGPEALEQTIVGLAQNFVGSNNINLLKPNGAFGTRATGGKDAAASRYIYTELSKITRKIFHPSDDPLYTYVQDDESTVEPEWYLPILPMVLVNGADGIGTGWSTNIPPFNPMDIIQNIKHLMDDEKMEDMHPWFKGWSGSIEKIESQRYRMYGRIEQTGPNILEITELPARTWTSTIKEYLLLGLSGSEKVKAWIKDMEEQHTDTIRFIITLTNEEMEKTRRIGFYERFRLTSTISLSNMIAFNAQGRIKRYETVYEILEEFYFVRLEYYQKRKDYMGERLQWEIEKLSYQVKFIKMIIAKNLTVTNKPRREIILELQNLGFPRIDKIGRPHYEKVEEKMDEAIPNEDEIDDQNSDIINGPEEAHGTYDYLLGMKIWALTKERYERLLKQKQEKEAELEELLKLSAKTLWCKDIDEFITSYEEFMRLDEEIRKGETSVKGKGKKRKTKSKDDADYNPSNKQKKQKLAKNAKKIGLNMIKDDPDFEKIMIEPKLLTKHKKVSKLKSENQSDTTPKPPPIKLEGATSTALDTPASSTVFDSKIKQENRGGENGFSAFSSRFKKLSSKFDDLESSKENTPGSADPSDTQSLDNDQLIEKHSTTVTSSANAAEHPAKKTIRKVNSRNKKPKSIESSSSDNDESFSDSERQDEEESIFVKRRPRASRASAPRKPLIETIDLSDESFIEPDENNESDESFKDED